MKKIVIIGGGTGTSTLLQGLKKYPLNLSVVVSSADDGGSTGILRKELGVFPPGDIRQCLLGLSSAGQAAQDLFSYRFDSGELKGHSAGNILIAALEKITGGIEPAIEEASKVLKTSGRILPVTLKPTLLSATLENGKIIRGEHHINEYKFKAISPIKNLELTPPGPANPKVIFALKSADVIIFGPGDLYTSILPNILVKGVAGAVINSKAKKILITNIMTVRGQTDGFKASDFVKVLERYLKGKIGIVLANNKKPGGGILARYAKEKAKFVEADMPELAKTKVEAIAEDLLSQATVKKNPGDKLKRSLLRHDPSKLAKLIYELI